LFLFSYLVGIMRSFFFQTVLPLDLLRFCCL
jgi:hypothetical protein